MNDLTLTNDIAPKPDHPSNAAFKPESPTSILRQKIWRYLQENIGREVPLSEIVEATKEKYSKVYNAAKHLCMKHLAVRKEEPRFRIKEKTQEKIELKPIIKLAFVPPFSSGKGPMDNKKRTLW